MFKAVNDYLERKRHEKAMFEAKRAEDERLIEREKHMLRAGGSNVVLVYEFLECFEFIKSLNKRALDQPLIQLMFSLYRDDFAESTVKHSRKDMDFYQVFYDVLTPESKITLEPYIKIEQIAASSHECTGAWVDQQDTDNANRAFLATKLSNLTTIWDEVCDAEYIVNRSLEHGQGQDVLTVLKAFNALSAYRSDDFDIGSGPKKPEEDAKDKSFVPDWGGPLPVGG